MQWWDSGLIDKQLLPRTWNINLGSLQILLCGFAGLPPNSAKQISAKKQSKQISQGGGGGGVPLRNKSASLWKLFLYQKIYLSCFAFKCLKVRYMCLLLSAKLNWLFAVEIPNLISNFHRIKKCPVYLGLINLKLCWLKELFQHISSLYFDWTNWPLVLYSWWVGEREKANKLQSLDICSIKFSGCNIEM